MTYNVISQYLNNRYFSTAGFSINNALYAWGNNSIGELAQGNTTNRSSPVQVGSLNYWSRVSCGYNYFSLGIQSPGTLWSWGSNSFGQLGVNTSGANNTSSPVQVPFPIYQGWSQIIIPGTNQPVNGISWLGIQNDSTLWAWGDNTFGQLGLNTTITSTNSPAQVGTSNTWTSLATGTTYPYVLAIQSPGTLWAWGNNQFGQLGLSNSTNRSSPTQVGTSSNWTQVAAGNFSSFGIQNNGALYVWGSDSNSQLGLNTNSGITVFSPILMPGGSVWTQIASGAGFTVALQSNGTLWAWGFNSSGALGLGDLGARISPVQVGANSNWTQVVCGYSSTFALQTPGTLWSWGNNSYGQLGLGNLVNRSSPVQIGALNYWTQINSGQLSTLAVQSDGTLWAWGNNTNGVLGLNTSTIQYSSPVQVGTQSYYVRTSIADGYKCFASAIIASPATNSIGALFLAGSTGTSGINNTSSPIQLFGVSTLYSIRNWTQIAAGNAHWLAVQSPGTLWSCGYNGSGQLGNNTSSTSIGASTPIQIGLLNSWSQVAGGNFASYAIRVPGTLWAWGYNVQGQLGQGNTVNYSSPVQVGAVTTWQQISVNSTSATALALQSAGTLWAWGFNGFGQIGNSNTNNQSNPVQIGALTTWTRIANGGFSSYAIQSNGTLWAWGLNSQGQLGLNTTVGVSSPVQVGTGSTWVQVGAGALQLAAIQNNGTLWMCGYNAQGQLGNSNTTNISSLVQVGSLNKWNFATGARQILAQQVP